MCKAIYFIRPRISWLLWSPDLYSHLIAFLVNFSDHLQSAHGIRVDVNDIDGDTAHRARVEAEKEMMRNFRSSIDNLIESTVKERETDRWVEGEEWVEGKGWVEGEGDRWVEAKGWVEGEGDRWVEGKGWVEGEGDRWVEGEGEGDRWVEGEGGRWVEGEGGRWVEGEGGKWVEETDTRGVGAVL